MHPNIQSSSQTHPIQAFCVELLLFQLGCTVRVVGTSTTNLSTFGVGINRRYQFPASHKPATSSSQARPRSFRLQIRPYGFITSFSALRGPEAAHSRGPHRLQPNGDDIRLRHRTAALQQPIDHLVELELPPQARITRPGPLRPVSLYEQDRSGPNWKCKEHQGAGRARKYRRGEHRRGQERKR